MKKLTLRIAEHKLSTFLAFIRDLDYVEVMPDDTDLEKTSSSNPHQTQSDDFFDLAGMWEGRDISADELRKKAWPIRK